MFHRHLEVGVHHRCIHVARTPNVYRARWMQRGQHLIYASDFAIVGLFLNCHHIRKLTRIYTSIKTDVHVLFVNNSTHVRVAADTVV